MSGDTATVIISGVVSLTSAFGSILLKDHLDLRREARKAAAVPAAARSAVIPTSEPATARVAEAAGNAASSAKVAPSIWDAYVAPAPGPTKTGSPGNEHGAGPAFSSQPPSPAAAPAAAASVKGVRRSPPPAPAAAPPPVARSTAVRGSTVRAAATVVTGFVLGNIIAGGGQRDFIPVLAVMVAATIALLVYFVRPRHRSLTGYLLGTVSLWAAFVGGISFHTGSVSHENLTVFYFISGVFAVLGLVAFGLTYRWGRRARR